MSDPKPPTVELGNAGISMRAGLVHEDLLEQLNGRTGRRIYREMADNGSAIGAFLHAVEMLVRAMEWRYEPANVDDSDAVEGQVFMMGVMQDMSHSWDDFIAEVFSHLIYGWSYFEVVVKRRVGPHERRSDRRSQFTDGRIGLRKLAIRPQNTLDAWDVDPSGGVQGMWQQDTSGRRSQFLPIARCLHFRAGNKRSPEGRSILRTSYRPWHFLKNIEEVEGIAIERDLNGLPVVRVPSALLKADASSQERAALADYIRLVRDIKMGEQGGVVLPSNEYLDGQGNPTGSRMVDLELLSTKGTRLIDTVKVAQRYEHSIARNMLAEFLMLGQGDVGSFALSQSKVELFARSIEGWTKGVAETWNRHLTPRLWRLNAFPAATMPRLVPGRVAPENIEELARFVEALARAGAPLFPNDVLLDNLLRRGDLPEVNAEGG